MLNNTKQVSVYDFKLIPEKDNAGHCNFSRIDNDVLQKMLRGCPNEESSQKKEPPLKGVIIAISGLQGSGKDTIGNYLVGVHGFIKISFASALKDAVAAIFGWNRALLEGDTKESRIWREQVDKWWAKELGIADFSPRKALQLIGTDILRDRFHPDIWILSLKKQLIEYQRWNRNLVITDCRFPNEMQMLREIGAKLVHVYRDKVTPEWFNDFKYGSMTESELTQQGIHPSEYMWTMESHHHIIENNGSIENTYERVNSFLRDQCLFCN